MFRLNKLWVEDYKNLKDFTIDFADGDGFSMLIGTNGSGKSNVLEVISGIFHDAYLKDSFSINSNYRIEYVIDNDRVTINKKQRRQFRINNILQNRVEFINKNALPKNVIAIYSGEENRLWEKFFEYYYFQYIRNINDPSKYTSDMKLMFVNKFYWEIALFVMLFSESDDIKIFRQQYDLQDIQEFKINFNQAEVEKSKNLLLKNFIEAINPNKRERMSIKFPQLKKRIHSLNMFEREIFINLTQANLPKKDKLINEIFIKFNSGVTTRELSEGEKKHILIQATLEFLADEKTLLLFDEPDAHINEAKKNSVYHLMQKYKQPQIIMTTHSPTLTKIAHTNEKIILQKSENGNASIVPCNDIEALEKISDGLWTANAESIVFISQKPLILVEGIGDINYINHAINILSQDEPKYRNIDCEFLPYGGAGNAIHFIEKIKSCIAQRRKVIVIFDRDKKGGEGIKKCINTGNDRERHHEIYQSANFYYFMLPKTQKHTGKDFVIEDYFDIDKKKDITQYFLDQAQGCFNDVPTNLKDKLKKELEKFYPTAQSADLQGFKVLLDRIYNIVYDKEICISV